MKLMTFFIDYFDTAALLNTPIPFDTLLKISQTLHPKLQAFPAPLQNVELNNKAQPQVTRRAYHNFP